MKKNLVAYGSRNSARIESKTNTCQSITLSTEQQASPAGFVYERYTTLYATPASHVVCYHTTAASKI